MKAKAPFFFLQNIWLKDTSLTIMPKLPLTLIQFSDSQTKIDSLPPHKYRKKAGV